MYLAATTTEILISEVEIIWMLIPSRARTSNMRAAMPACVRIPTPTMDTLDDVEVAQHLARADLSRQAAHQLERLVVVGAGDGERHVGGAVRAGVLDDHVHDDAGRGHGAEEPRRHPGLIGHAPHRELCLVLVGRDAGDRDVLHAGILLDDPGALALVERRADVHRHVVALRELDGPDLQHLGAEAGQLEHLVVGDALELACLRHHARVARVDPVDVGVDLAHVRPQRRRQRDGRRVGATAPEGGDPPVGGHALETGDDRHHARGQRLAQRPGVDTHDARLAVCVVRVDADLVTEKRARLDPEPLQHDRGQRRRHLLAGGGEHVGLALVRSRMRRLGQRQQPVGLARHRRDDDHHRVPGSPCPRRPVGDDPNAVDVGDRRAAELLYDERHARPSGAARDQRQREGPWARGRESDRPAVPRPGTP